MKIINTFCHLWHLSKNLNIYDNPENFYIDPTYLVGVIGSHTFNVPGIYNYDCSIGLHAAAGMVGTITVGVGGCIDENACNFNENADFDDGSCLDLDCQGTCGGSDFTCSGCADVDAFNYDSNSIGDGGDCVYVYENSKILYMDRMGFGGSQREKMDMVLEPMQVMIQLALVSYSQIGSKISVCNNILTIQKPSLVQGVYRWWNGYNKDRVKIQRVFHRTTTIFCCIH